MARALLACAVLAPWPLQAATGGAGDRWAGLAETVFQNYSRDQGLPHPVPTALAQDRDGFLWIGTQGGLARWDGYRFHGYTADPAVPGSLPSDYVQALHIDPAGRLWIAASGLARYDAARDRFVSVPLGPATGLTHTAALADDGDDGLWIGTDDGLRHLNIQTGAVSVVHDGLPDGRVLALLHDRAGTLWAGTTTGLARAADERATFTPFPVGGPSVGVSALFQDGDGRIWIGTRGQGVFVIDGPDAPPRPVGADTPLASGTVGAIRAVGPHEIWVALRFGGIMAVDTDTGRVTPIRHDRTLPNSLAHNDVWALLLDTAGSVWVGGTGGLGYHPRDAGLVSTIYGASDRAQGLSAADALSILPTGGGRVWLGYVDGGADLIDPVTGRVAPLRPDAARPETALPPAPVFGLAQDGDGGVYIGTHHGLYRADAAGRAVKRLVPPGRDPRAPVSALAYDAGVLWMGGETDGLWGLAPDGGGTARLVYSPADTPPLTDPGIEVIRRGAGHDLWVGTRNGLNRIDLSTRAVERITADVMDAGALPAGYVTGLLFDRQGRLWVSTFGGGIAVLDDPTPAALPRRFHRLGLADGLPHLNVDSLQMDGDGIIWAGTDDGLARIDPETMAIRPVRRADGGALVDYFVAAGATTNTGEVLLGAKGGLTVIHPGTLPPWRFTPPIVVTDLRVGGVSRPISLANSAGGTPITVTPDADSLAVEFAALDYTAPERNRYAYRLDGYDHDWVTADVNRRLAVYTNLPPGDYTLRLRGSNRDGVWTERQLALPIRVLPAWYQELWFKLLGAAVAGAAVMGLVRWRTNYLRHRQRVLEQQIDERTADLSAANERLAQLAMTDTLTDCANRRHFMERAREMVALSNRHGLPLSLAILDLDEFKAINDTCGHPGGDAVLAMVGRIIGGHGRTTDLAGRIGGEEFALLMPHTVASDARLLAERLRGTIGDAQAETDGKIIRVTASVGVADLYPGEDLESLYARADTALYMAKQSGRNRVTVIASAE
ncbi:MAG: diguanylate cyclase [Azospirillaceae bacterium]|nr:diguanylate cyclase [Azospirillaceae bacterium]